MKKKFNKAKKTPIDHPHPLPETVLGPSLVQRPCSNLGQPPPGPSLALLICSEVGGLCWSFICEGLWDPIRPLLMQQLPWAFLLPSSPSAPARLKSPVTKDSYRITNLHISAFNGSPLKSLHSHFALSLPVTPTHPKRLPSEEQAGTGAAWRGADWV